MERRVENQDLRDAGKRVGDALDAHQVSAGVQRSEVAAELKLLNDLGGDENRLGEVGAAMHDAVTDRFDLVHRLDTAVFGRSEGVDEDLGSDRVVRHGQFSDKIFPSGHFVSDFAIDSDALADALRHYVKCSSVEKLVFERGRARVYN